MRGGLLRAARSSGYSIMPGPQPLNIFIVAEQFRFAGKLAALAPILVDRYPEFEFARDQRMSISTMVCAALSLELYFKCLIRLGRKPYKSIHDLEKLFNLISPKT
jgi:hypothetical protein